MPVKGERIGDGGRRRADVADKAEHLILIVELLHGVGGSRRSRALTGKPLVAIGGITRANAPAVFAAGADSVALIADLLPERATAADVRRRIEDWRAIADAPATL